MISANSHRRTVGENAIFFRRDPNRPDNRAQVQHLCFEAFEHKLRLSEAEKTVIIMITNCSAHDAHMFCVYPLHVVEFENTNKALGSWLERHRTAYFAMQNCIALLNRAQSGHENTGAAN